MQNILPMIKSRLILQGLNFHWTVSVVLTFFFSILKLSIITPIKRLSVKNEPQTMNITK